MESAATQNIRNCFRATSGSNGDAALIDTTVLAGTQANARDLVEEAIAGDSVLIFGQRPGSLSAQEAAQQAAVPEQASLFNFG